MCEKMVYICMKRLKACHEIEKQQQQNSLDFLFFVSIHSCELIKVWNPFYEWFMGS